LQTLRGRRPWGLPPPREPPQLNVPAMEGHLHRQHLEAWRRLTAKVHSTALLPAVLAEAFELPVIDPEGR
jgi:hypothetical protein